MRWDSGRWRRLRYGWRVKLVDQDARWYLSASRTKLRQDVRCNLVVADDVVELETIELRTMCGSRTGGWSLPCVMSD
jgi:hypothetical protein